jgi:tetratricopeptide (TPR) repeat protein
VRDSYDLSGDFRHASISIATGASPSEDDDGCALNEALELLREAASSHVPVPAPLPSGSALPWSPNPTFKGRDRDLKRFAELLLSASGTEVVPTIAVTGLGGLGKTQLAAEFAHRYGRYFKGGVFWINCGEPEAIQSQVAGCGWGLHLHPAYRELSLPDQIQLVRSAWHRKMPRLLIFDACEDEHTLAEWRPTTGGAKVILTSRRPNWEPASGVKPIKIEPLLRQDSVNLLRHGRGDLTAGDPTLDAIAAELGDLPLALHLAGLFLEKFRHSTLGDPKNYLQTLRRSPVLRHRSMTMGGWSPTGHDQHIARTFALSYDQLASEGQLGEMARALLSFAGHFAPEVPIPRYVLSPSDALDADPAVLELQEEAVLRLTELGLIDQLSDGALVLHQLVAAFTQLEPTPEGSTAEDVEKYLIISARSVNIVTDPRLLAALEPHILHAAGSAAKRGSANAVELYTHLGQSNYERGNYAEARATFERAVSLSEKIAETNDTDRANALNGLALVDRITGNIEAAIKRQRQALAILEASTSTRELPLGAATYNLGRALLASDPDEAAALFDKAARVAERASQEKPKDEAATEARKSLVRALTGLAEAKMATRPSAAPSEAEKAIAVAEEAFGKNAFELWRPLYVLGEIHRLENDFEPARQCLIRSVQIIEERQGEDSPLLGDVLISLGQTQHRVGDVAGARQSLERAIEITERTVGLYYSGVRPAIEVLSRVYLELKDYRSCRYLLEREVDIIASIRGDQRNLAIVLCSLGIACASMGDREAALHSWKRSKRLLAQFKDREWKPIFRQLQQWIKSAERRP